MTEKEKWEIAISIISTTITLVTLIYSIILGRKANSRKLKIIKKLYDKDNKECKNGINCSSIYVYLTNIGNRNIKIYNLKIEINYRNKLDLNSIIYSNNNKLNVDESRSYEIPCKTIKETLFDLKDEIKPNKKLILYFYDNTNKKFKIKFNIKLLDILNQNEETKVKHFEYNIKTNDIREVKD